MRERERLSRPPVLQTPHIIPRYKSDGIVRLNRDEMTAEISDEVVLNSGDGDVDDPLGDPAADRRVDDPLESGNAEGFGGARDAESAGSVASADELGDGRHFRMDDAFRARVVRVALQ